MVWGQNLSNTLPFYIFISGWNENLTITISLEKSRAAGKLGRCEGGKVRRCEAGKVRRWEKEESNAEF